ncbi:DUF6083 domain-containing protein [Streptomyces sp. NBC_00102]|uniref:DUF6083 domain-containing protein n=1 Tax=Streptomyces sp. NBC_00102 TaxID=2975652 RepID=UPI00224F28EE|nr:DUF6083 domain-containing protein [Streptomyces sp. NBC_00102]MCX5401380.1 DUF6083 domain-containing protein [Streptomyces sp. NBC_00102]
MGDTGNTAPGPDSADHIYQALLEGAIAPRPPHPPECPFCDLRQDRYPTHYGDHWVLLEPGMVVAAHTVPPHDRWIVLPDGRAMNLWDAEPVPGTRCHIPHRLVCPYLRPGDFGTWVTVLRQENRRRAGRLFELPEDGPSPVDH